MSTVQERIKALKAKEESAKLEKQGASQPVKQKSGKVQAWLAKQKQESSSDSPVEKSSSGSSGSIPAKTNKIMMMHEKFSSDTTNNSSGEKEKKKIDIPKKPGKVAELAAMLKGKDMGPPPPIPGGRPNPKKELQKKISTEGEPPKIPSSRPKLSPGKKPLESKSESTISTSTPPIPRERPSSLRSLKSNESSDTAAIPPPRPVRKDSSKKSEKKTKEDESSLSLSKKSEKKPKDEESSSSSSSKKKKKKKDDKTLSSKKSEQKQKDDELCSSSKPDDPSDDNTVNKEKNSKIVDKTEDELDKKAPPKVAALHSKLQALGGIPMIPLPGMGLPPKRKDSTTKENSEEETENSIDHDAVLSRPIIPNTRSRPNSFPNIAIEALARSKSLPEEDLEEDGDDEADEKSSSNDTTMRHLSMDRPAIKRNSRRRPMSLKTVALTISPLALALAQEHEKYLCEKREKEKEDHDAEEKTSKKLIDESCANKEEDEEEDEEENEEEDEEENVEEEEDFEVISKNELEDNDDEDGNEEKCKTEEKSVSKEGKTSHEGKVNNNNSSDPEEEESDETDEDDLI